MQMDLRRDLAVAPIAPPKPETQSQASRMEEACAQPLSRIVEELELCRRYHETTFPNSPVQRLIFIGGEARQKALCQSIARQLGVAAQIGDPMIRLGKTAELPADCGLDVTQPQPAWAVAIGLSMGAAVVAAAKSK
jgi:Tfp pilus assembly PilM family ATPase